MHSQVEPSCTPESWCLNSYSPLSGDVAVSHADEVGVGWQNPARRDNDRSDIRASSGGRQENGRGWHWIADSGPWARRARHAGVRGIETASINDCTGRRDNPIRRSEHIVQYAQKVVAWLTNTLASMKAVDGVQ